MSNPKPSDHKTMKPKKPLRGAVHYGPSRLHSVGPTGPSHHSLSVGATGGAPLGVLVGEDEQLPDGRRIVRVVNSLDVAALLGKPFKVPWIANAAFKARYDGAKIVIDALVMNPEDIKNLARWEPVNEAMAETIKESIARRLARWWSPLIVNDGEPIDRPKSEK